MDEAKALLERAERLHERGVKGAQKVIKKIRAEMRFLEGKGSEEKDDGASSPV